MAVDTRRVQIRAALIALAIAWLPGGVLALQPPRADEWKQYAKDGTLEKRIDQATRSRTKAANPHLVREARRHAAAQRLSTHGRGTGNSRTDMVEAPDTAGTNMLLTGEELTAESNLLNGHYSYDGLPSLGSPQVFVLLIEFPDALHNDNVNSAAAVEGKFFGDGNAAQIPYESVRNYYQRSSYGKLTIQGDVFAWYTASHNRSYYESLGNGDEDGREALIKEALDHLAQSHDFAKYDNDGNGQIDAFYVKWTGPDQGMGAFWSSDTKGWSDGAYRVSGKQLGYYVWSPISYGSVEEYAPRADLHETGRLLGLPQLWDSQPNIGPPGGVGKLDMMDGNLGDHNCFSKYLLGWVTPTIISGSFPQNLTLSLRPSATSEDCVLMVSNGDPADPNIKYGELFMAQYRKPIPGTNDADLPGSGLLIWHVDATRTNNHFLHNNSDTCDRKFIRLMEADGLEQIQFGAPADAGDFYTFRGAFNAHTKPSNMAYPFYTNCEYQSHPVSSGVTVNVTSTPGETLTAQFGVLLKPEIKWKRDAQTNTLVWESCVTNTGHMDPYEHVRLAVTLVNVGARSAFNVNASMTYPEGAEHNNIRINLHPNVPVDRLYTFTVPGTCGEMLPVSINLAGQYQDVTGALVPTPGAWIQSEFQLGAPVIRMEEIFDSWPVGFPPPGWTVLNIPQVAESWRIVSGETSNYIQAHAPDYVSDNSLISPVIHVSSDSASLEFRHSFKLEKIVEGYDGGVLEIKIGQDDFVDIFTAGGAFREGGYTGIIAASGHGSPIEGRHAWTGNSGGFIRTEVSLPTTAAGQEIQLRWRLATDNEQTVAGAGWSVDSIYLYDGYSCCTFVPGDLDRDGDVDQEDFGLLQRCFTGSGGIAIEPCRSIDSDQDVDRDDVSILSGCWSGPNVPAVLGCWP